MSNLLQFTNLKAKWQECIYAAIAIKPYSKLVYHRYITTKQTIICIVKTSTKMTRILSACISYWQDISADE